MNAIFFENDYVQYKIEEGILLLHFKPHLTKIDVRIAKTIVHDRLEFTQGERVPTFVDTSNALYMDKESRMFFASEEAIAGLKVVGLLIHNPMAAIAAKLFLVLNKPQVKTELFYDNEKALTWLKRYR